MPRAQRRACLPSLQTADAEIKGHGSLARPERGRLIVVVRANDATQDDRRDNGRPGRSERGRGGLDARPSRECVVHKKHAKSARLRASSVDIVACLVVRSGAGAARDEQLGVFARERGELDRLDESGCVPTLPLVEGTSVTVFQSAPDAAWTMC